MKPSSHTVLIIIAALIVAAGAYWYFFTGTSNEPPISAVGIAENAAQVQFRTLVGKLPISFDTSIFSDPRFSVLIDLTTPISPESSGRSDPFATLSGTRVK